MDEPFTILGSHGLVYAEAGPCACGRVVSAILLYLFLEWVVGNDTAGSGPYPLWKGWVITLALGSTGYLQTFAHHQLFWYGWATWLG